MKNHLLVLAATTACVLAACDTGPGSTPVSWREPVRYDVFEADGTFLAAVSAPEGFSTSTDPVFDGDYVWAVTRDELGVERVVRFRIVVG